MFFVSRINQNLASNEEKPSSESRLKITHIEYASYYPQFNQQIESLLADENLDTSIFTDLFNHNSRHHHHHSTQKKEKRPETETKQELNRKLFDAVANNKLNELEQLLIRHKRRDFNVNSTLIGGLRAIHIAAQLGLDDALDVLKVNGAAFVTEKSQVHPIFVAAAHGQVMTVHKLLRDYNVDINLQGQKQETLLHIAVKRGDKLLTDSLLKAGANPDYCDEEGMTPIALATLLGNIEAFRALKDHGACLGIRTFKGQYIFHFMAMHGSFYQELKKYRTFFTVSDDRDCTCLHFAIVAGNLKAVKQILKHGTHQLDLLTADRHTAVTLACASAQSKILDFLLTKYYKSGRQLQKYETPMKDVLTPTHVVAEFGDLETLLVLDKHGKLEVDKPTAKRNFTPLHLSCISANAEITDYLIDKGSAIKVLDSKVWYPVHYAIQNKMIDSCKKMLPHFTADDFRTGTTPLHLASKTGHLELVNILLKNGHDPTVLDKLGYSALHYASARGFVDVLQALIKSNARVHRTSAFHETPLFLACINGRPDAALKLKEAGANINIPNQEGKKAFHEACLRGHVDVVEVILGVPRMKFDINGLCVHGLAPLHVACANNQHTIAGILIREGANIDVKDTRGMTPIHHAALHGSFKIVESLVQLGAKRRLKDDNDMRPIDHAIKHRHEDIVQYLNSLRQKAHDELPDVRTDDKQKKPIKKKLLVDRKAMSTNSFVSDTSSIS